MVLRTRLVLLFLVLASVAAFAADAPRVLKRRPLFGAQVMPGDGGVQVGHVLPGGAADEAGLREGDVVVSLGGRAVADPPQFIGTLKSLGASTVDVVVKRGGETMTRKLVLAEAPRETSSEYDVVYDSVPAAGALRRTILTKPRDAAKHPAVLFVGGIGCYSLDGAPAVVSGYIGLIQELTRRGFVVMRVEKSGMGDSEGVPCQLQDFDNELAGYRAGLAKLRTYPFVDAKRVFIVGHSIGGLVAPVLAGETPVRGVVAMSTAGQKWFDYENVNARRQLAMEGSSGDELEAKVALKAQCARQLMIDRKAPEAIVAAEPKCAEYLQYPAHYRYIQQVAQLDPDALWKKVDAKVLLVHGLSDFVTDADEHRRIERAVNAAHPGHATLLLEPQMDHFLRQVASTAESLKALKTGAMESNPLNTNVRDDIAKWLLRTAG